MMRAAAQAACSAPERKRQAARNIERNIGDVSMTFRRTGRTAFLSAIALAATAFSSGPGAAFASDAQQMCSGDAMRLCGHEIPNIQRITACMHKQRANVSPGCRAVMDRDNINNNGRRRAAAAGE
jgi:hypothetical protein